MTMENRSAEQARSLIDNAEMSLAKTDRAIAVRYLALGGNPRLTEQVLAEYDRTRRLVLAVTGHDRLVANRPVLSRAIVLRDPYVDALSYLQLRALSALRADDVAEGRAMFDDRPVRCSAELGLQTRQRVDGLLAQRRDFFGRSFALGLRDGRVSQRRSAPESPRANARPGLHS